MKRVVFGIIVTAIGVMMITDRAGVLNLDLSWLTDCEWKKYIIPTLIIIVGLRLMSGGRHGKRNRCADFKDADLSNMKEGDILNASVAFSGSRYNMNDQLFNGAKLDVFFGGIALDLYGAEIVDKCTIEVHALFGGVEIKAPSNVKFITSSSCIMGGVDNKHNWNSDNCTKTIFLKADCMLGGVRISK